MLTNIELRNDPVAKTYVKNEVVLDSFAVENGALMSLEGLNRYCCGDAIVKAESGNRWVVSRERFEQKYQALGQTQMGEDGQYAARQIPVLARQMHEPFSIARSAGGDVLNGTAGDWLVQYAPDDFGVVEQTRIALVYRLSNVSLS